MNLFYPLVYCLLFIPLFCTDTNVINMIISHLSFDERPSSLLTPDLCWSPYLQNLLAKMLNDNAMSTAHSLQQHHSSHQLQRLLIFMDFNCPQSYELLVNASNLGYFKSPYRWLIVLTADDNHNLEIFSNVDVFVDSEVVIARRLSEVDFVLTEVYKISETSSLIELKRGSWHGIKRPTKHLPKNEILQVSNTVQVYEDSNNTQVELYVQIINKTEKPREGTLVFNAEKTKVRSKEKKEIQITRYGLIEDYRESKVLSSRRNNLQGHALTMVNVITDSNDTRNHLDDRLKLHQDSITKMSWMVVSVCFSMLNASERRMFTHTWGYRDKRGNWQGLVNHLLKKEGDLGTLTLFTKERMEQVDYIAMVGTTALRFVFREPPLSYVSNIFALPFTSAVWMAILICVIGCSVFLYITSKWEATLGMHPLQLDGSWADVLILIISAVLQQGCTLEPRYAAGRCVTLFVFMSLTILYAAYSANIVVLLRAPSSSVRTLADLLNSPLKLGASNFEYNRYFFMKLNDPVRKAIYEKKIAPKGKKANYYSMKEGIEKIRQGLFAFHMEVNPGYRIIQDTYKEDEKCDLVEIDFINENDPWVPAQKRSPFKELFKISFMRIRESGIQYCIHRRLHVPRPRCSGTISTFSSVGIQDIYPALLITLYGFLFAPVLLLFEIAYKRLLLIRNNIRSRNINIPYTN